MPGLVTGGLGTGGSLALKGLGGGGGGGVVLPPARIRDDLVLLDIESRLAAIEDFKEVISETGPNNAPIADDRMPFVYIWQPLFIEETDATNGGEEDVVHRGTFFINLWVRETDRVQRIRTLWRLINVILNALDGKSLGGATFPAMTTIGRGQYIPDVSAPNAGFRLIGTWEAVIAGNQAHDTQDDGIYPL